MTDALIQLIAHAPAAVAVIFVVIVFLKDRRASDTLRQADQKRCHAMHEKTTDKMTDALDRNTSAFVEMSVHLEQSVVALEDRCLPKKSDGT